jgi:hypothetical protein
MTVGMATFMIRSGIKFDCLDNTNGRFKYNKYYLIYYYICFR